MSDEGRSYWFCPACVERGSYVGVIGPDQPEHPMFEQRLRRDPEVVLGHEMVIGPTDHPKAGHVGTIADYGPESETYTIAAPSRGIWDESIRRISHVRLQELLWLPDVGGRRAHPPGEPTGLHLYLE
jgi:hypothetical protein